MHALILDVSIRINKTVLFNLKKCFAYCPWLLQSSTSSTTFLLREVVGEGLSIGASISHTAIMLTHGDLSKRITVLPQQSFNPSSPKISSGCEKTSMYIKSFYQLVTNTTTIFLFKCSDISYKAIKHQSEVTPLLPFSPLKLPYIKQGY